MSYKRNIKSTFTTQVVILLIGFLSSVLVARALGPIGQGQVTYFMLFFGMMARFGNFGINDSLGFFIKRTEYSNKKIINNNFTFITILTVFYFFIFLLLYYFGFFLTDYNLILVILGVLFIYLNFLESNFKSIYMVREETFISNKYKLTANIVKFTIILFLYYINIITVNIFILLNVFIFVLPIVLMIKNLNFNFSFNISRDLIKKQLKYGFILYLSAAMIFLTYKVDQFMIENYLGMAHLGVYSIGVQLAELIFIIPHSIIIPLRGKLFNMKGENTVEREKITALTTKITMYVCVLLVIIGVMLSPLIPVFYGNEYKGAVSITRILLVGIIFASIGKVASNYFYTEGLTLIHLYISAFVLAINVGLNFLLIPSMGIEGAALASTISYLFYGLLYIIIFIRRGDLELIDFVGFRKKEFDNLKAVIKK